MDEEDYDIEDILENEENNQNNNFDIEDILENDKNKNQFEEENKKENNENNIINNLYDNSNIENQIKRKQKKIEIPDLNNSIELINYFETKYYLTQIEDDQNYSKLINNKYNYEPFQIQLKQNLFLRIQEEIKNNLITSLFFKNDNFFLGNSLGIIKRFSLGKEIELGNLNYETFEKKRKIKVTCIDVSNDLNYLISGYSNGWIILWDLKTLKHIKLFSEEHNKCILSIKLITCDGKSCSFISSDISGKVNKIILSKKFFFNASITCNNIINENDNLYYKIEILNTFNEKEKIKGKIPDLMAFVSQKKICIYHIDNNNIIFDINQDNDNKSIFPDFCFGVGYLPRTFTFQRKKRIDINEIALKNDFDLEQKHILFLISFDKIVKIYSIKFNNKELELILLGQYENNCQIIKIQFLLNSIFCIFDIDNNLSVLNSGLLLPELIKGKKQLNNDSCLIIKKTFNVFKDNEYFNLIEEESNINEKDEKKIIPPLIKILGENNIIIIITEELIQEGKLLTYDNYILELQKKNEWIESLKLGIDIYLGEKNAFLGLPINDEKRKEVISLLLKELIVNYININLDNSFYKNKKNEYNNIISDCIKTCIDLCLEIDSQNFLFYNILPLFEQKNFLWLFIYNLESYILKDEIKEELDYEIIQKIITFYAGKNEIDILSQILYHLNIKSIEREIIKSLCQNYQLLTPLIYIYMNGKEKNYQSALESIQESFKMSNISQEVDSILSYKEILDKISISDFIKSKQYIGIKLLWYINLCVEGINFQTNTIIEENLYIVNIQQIFIWLIQDTYFDVFVQIDSLSFFYLLSKMFLSNKSFNALSNTQLDSMIYKGMTLNQKPIINLDFLSLIQNLIEKGKNYAKHFWITFDFYTFIIEISKKSYTIKKKNYRNLIDKENIIEGIKCLLDYFNKENNNNKENLGKDLFGFHLEIEKREMNKIAQMINDTLNNYKDSFENNEIIDLLKYLRNENFFAIKIYLLQIINDYNQCLITYIKEYSKPNKDKVVFHFIEKTLKLLYDIKNNDTLNSFKKTILDNILNLSKLSIKLLSELITIWFDNNQKLVIDILENEDKLNYIEYILQQYKEEELSPGDQEYQNYIFLLPIQLDLLCKLGKKEEVLKNLKKRILYPEKCIGICEKYNLIEGEIFLFQRYLKFQEAIKISLESVSKEFLSMQDNNKYDEISEQNFYSFIDISIEICENAQTNSNEQFWDMLIRKCNELRNDLQNKYKGDLKEKLSVLIKNGIEKKNKKMFSFFDIKQILQFILDSENAEYQDYKQIFKDIMNNYIHTNRILGIIKSLSISSVDKTNINFLEEIKKGNFYKINKCDVCDKKFNKNQKGNIELFHCGHLMHSYCCLKKDNKILCRLCQSNENEEGNENEEDKVENPPQNSNFFNTQVEKRIKRLKMEKIRRLDKQFFEEGFFS